MKINIRKADENDFPAVLSLIKELAEYENAPEKVTNTVDLMKKEKDLFICYVAETENLEIVGMALFFFAYYTWVGKSLYLDDIYVRESYRQRKIGKSLLKKVFEIARDEECKRVRWQVLNWNKPAIEVYKKCGAEIDDEWLNCSFDSDGIKNFAMLD
ncbi:MAG TPA: GNAT family N-acetyltransferase [Bacteroidales bacterium]|jgi:GNAT superfamily N-acetyltransferase|nr:GNAT family N-acetyltransferase [Bacteroidales bacterium]